MNSTREEKDMVPFEAPYQQHGGKKMHYRVTMQKRSTGFDSDDPIPDEYRELFDRLQPRIIVRCMASDAESVMVLNKRLRPKIPTTTAETTHPDPSINRNGSAVDAQSPIMYRLEPKWPRSPDSSNGTQTSPRIHFESFPTSSGQPFAAFENNTTSLRSTERVELKIPSFPSQQMRLIPGVTPSGKHLQRGSTTRWSINSGVSTTSPVDQLFARNPRSLPTADLIRQPQQSKGPTEPPCRRPSSHYSDYFLYSREIFKHAPKLKSFDPNKNNNNNDVYSDDRFTIRRKTFSDQYGSLDRSRDSSRDMTTAPRDRPTVGFVDRSSSIDLSAENRFQRNVWDRRSLQEDQSSAWPYFRTQGQGSFVDDTPGSGSSRSSMQSLEGIDDDNDDREGYQSDDYDVKRRTNLDATTELSTPELAMQYRKSPRGPGSRRASPQEVALQCRPSSGSPGNRPARLEIVAHSRDKRLSGESLRRSMLESIMHEKMKSCQISTVSDSSTTFDRAVHTADRKNVDGSPPDVGSNPTLRRSSVDDQNSDAELFKNSSLTSEISPSGEYLSSPDGAKPKKYVSSVNIFLGSIK